MQRVTIADVAAACGVSKATVSKALGMDPATCPVNADTRALVLRTAERLGYRAGWLASALNNGRTGTVVLVYTWSTPPMSGQNRDILIGLQETLEQQDLDLVLQRMALGSTRCLDHIRRGRYDAVVVFEHLPEALLPLLGPSGVPAVLLNASGPQHLPAAVPDDRQAGRLAAEHLIALGHRSLLFWHGDFIDTHPSARLRADAFLAAAAQAGVRAETRILLPERLAEELRADPTVATGVVCFHEHLAARLLQACAQVEIRVPDDLSVLTFNDSYVGQITMPALSAVVMPARTLGETAARLLLERLAGHQPGSVLIPVDGVTRRASTGLPKSN